MQTPRSAGKFLALTSLLLTAGMAQAQMGVPVFQEYNKRVEASQRIAPLETGLMGEQVNLYNGTTTFSTVDIDIPGNNALPVQLGRVLDVQVQPQGRLTIYDARLRSAGNWRVDVPYLSTTYPAGPEHAWPSQRCTQTSAPESVSNHFRTFEIWHGISVHVPGKGDADLLRWHAPVPKPSTGGPFYWSTSNRDVVDCIPMQSGLAGEGFRMTTPDGLRYYFDVAVSRQQAPLVKSVYTLTGMRINELLPRRMHYVLASKIEDRFGNTVQYQYNADGYPTRIWSNDGREITLSYANGRLASASANGRTWLYQYDASSDLATVRLPDNSQWSFTYAGTCFPRRSLRKSRARGRGAVIRTPPPDIPIRFDPRTREELVASSRF